MSETEDHEKQRLVTLKRLKRCDDNELERKLRLEKVVARLAVETEEERRARLEKMVATKRLSLGMEMDEDWRRIHTAQVGPGDRGRKKSKKWIGYDLDLIWTEIGVLILRNELARPVMGTIFLVIRECGSTLYAGLACTAPRTIKVPVNFSTNRLQEALYEDLPV